MIYILALIAWILTILAPCVLPVLPVILGSSLGTTDRNRPRIIIGSTVVCIVVFTLLLKVSTAFISIPASTRATISAVIIIFYGLTLVLPYGWERISTRLGLWKSQQLLNTSKTGVWKDILLWASLWPIFTTCSPTYTLILSLIFPVSIIQWTIATLVYALWFWLMLGLVVRWWRKVTKKLQWFANPNSRFKKLLWILLIIVWLLIATWYVKKIETAIISSDSFQQFDVGQLEQKLIKATIKKEK